MGFFSLHCFQWENSLKTVRKLNYFPNKCNSVNSLSISIDWVLPVFTLSKEISTLSICTDVIVNGNLWNTILNLV